MIEMPANFRANVGCTTYAATFTLKFVAGAVFFVDRAHVRYQTNPVKRASYHLSALRLTVSRENHDKRIGRID
jgi:hypothetical protein